MAGGLPRKCIHTPARGPSQAPQKVKPKVAVVERDAWLITVDTGWCTAIFWGAMQDYAGF